MVQHAIIVRATCVILFLSVLCATDLWAQEWGDPGPGGWVTVPPADYPAANSVTVFDRATIQIDVSEHTTAPALVTKRHIRFRALTRAGVDEIGNYNIFFDKDTRFSRFEAQTLRPDGSIVPVAEKDMLAKKDGDYLVRSFAFPALDSGCMVEVRYEIEGRNILSYYPWTLSSGYYTLESQLTLDITGQLQYTYRCTNIPAGRRMPLESTAKGSTTERPHSTYVWRLTNLPPIKSEPYMTCVSDYTASIEILLTGYAWSWKEQTWEQMGKWYEDYVDSYITLPRDLRETIAAVTKGRETQYDKSKAIYNHVVEQFETRQNSYSRMTHHKNLYGLWEKRYGSAWEKNILLVEMLRKARIKCWPVLICTRDHARFDPSYKDYSQFSHVLVFAEVEQGGIYLDASSKYCVYGTLPPVCRVDAGLLIDGLNSALTRVITNDPKSYRLDQTTIRIDSAGNAACSTSCMMTGYLASDYGDQFEHAEPDKYIPDIALPGLPKMSTTPVSTCVMDTLGRFSIETGYSIPGYAQVVGSALVATAPEFMFGENPFKSESRFTPVDFNYVFTYHSIVTLVAEDSAMEVVLPKDESFSIDGVTYTRKSTSEGASTRVESVLKITRPVFEIEEYPLVREMFRRVAEAAAEPVTWQTTGS